MTKKIKLTRPELKRQRDMLTRFARYLPMLKLKQQQLQLALRKIEEERCVVEERYRGAKERFDSYREILGDVAGVNVPRLAKCVNVKTTSKNIAGVNIPVFEEVVFEEARYSLFGTPPWVDRALLDLRAVNRLEAELSILTEQKSALGRELRKIIQRVNLFEKIKIPEAREAIRVIRIHLGDEMTAAVGRAKLAKGKLPGEQISA